MRVIGGQLKGLQLHAPKGLQTRPTSDRVRESLFQILGDITETRCLDLFAGTGALGIEALSRGAGSCVFVESDSKALQVLHRNVDAATARVAAPVRIVNGDYRRQISQVRSRFGPFDLIFLDPPYAQASAIARHLNRELPTLLTAGATVVAECSVREPLDLSIKLRDERRYGDTLVRIFKNEQSEANRSSTR